jgi:hypothetical protein
MKSLKITIIVGVMLMGLVAPSISHAWRVYGPRYYGPRVVHAGYYGPRVVYRPWVGYRVPYAYGYIPFNLRVVVH